MCLENNLSHHRGIMLQYTSVPWKELATSINDVACHLRREYERNSFFAAHVLLQHCNRS